MNYRFATIEDLDFLVDMRIRDLSMFSNQKLEEITIQNIREFYHSKITKNECFTLLGTVNGTVISTATVYYYDILPSNENTIGKVGQITNVWVSHEFRKKGIATDMVKKLINISKNNVGIICLNSSEEALKVYSKLGFIKKDNYLIYNYKMK